MIASFFVGNILLLILNLPLVGLWARMLHLPYQLHVRGHAAVLRHRRLQPAAERVRRRGHDGLRHHRLRLRKIDLPIAPLVLGLILGPLMEKSLRTSLEMSGGDFSIFFTRPLVPRAARRRRLIVLVASALRLAAAPRCARHRPTDESTVQTKEGGSRNAHVRDMPLRRAALRSPRRAGAAGAQNFPARPIQLMVAFPAGGIDRHRRRIVAAIAEKELGQPIVVVNKAGAGGQIGWTELARQRPDGYYIGFLNLPATNTIILDPERKAIFTEKDFTPIINQVLDPGVIWVRADSPYKTLQDLIDAAKKTPGTIRAATTGILSRRPSRHPDDRGGGPGAEFRIVHLDGGAAQFKESWPAMSTSPSTMSAASSSACNRARCGRWP